MRMRSIQPPDWHVTVLIVLGLSLLPGALSHPQVPGGGSGQPAPAPVVPWVTVDGQGVARTITPSVATDSAGARTTIDQPPDSLISTVTWTLSPGGTDRPSLATTYTGLAPVASATGTDNAAGAFLVCNRGQGTDEPFCLPKRGSVLHPGRTYYVTWETDFFQPPNISLSLQATWGAGGFTTDSFPASVGFYAWSIPADFLSSLPPPSPTPTATDAAFSTSAPDSLNVTLFLAYLDTETVDDENDMRTLAGPSVIVAEANNPSIDPGNNNRGDSSSKHIVSIAVPIIVVLVLFGLVGGFCFFSWRRTGRLPLPFVGSRGSSDGYGEGQSRRQRTGDGYIGGAGGGYGGGGDKAGVGVGIQLTDRDSWSPTVATGEGGLDRGRNVFREELRRQDLQRGR